MKKKLKSSAGFSLVEMLCAVAVLMLLCVMLNSGLSVAMKTYFDLTAEAETQLLLNSLTNAIAGELRYAHEAGGAEDGGLTYNGGHPLTLNESDGHVYAGGVELLPQADAATGRGGAYKNGDYQVKVMDIGYDRDTACFTLKLEVGWKDGGVSAKTPEDGVVIRCLNPPEELEEEGGGP